MDNDIRIIDISKRQSLKVVEVLTDEECLYDIDCNKCGQKGIIKDTVGFIWNESQIIVGVNNYVKIIKFQ